jgi:ribosomal protein S6E (S10)
MYAQHPQQVVYSMPPTYPVGGYGYGGMPMTTTQYMPGGAGMIVQDPYGYSTRRRHRRRRHSYGGYPPYY